jgi:membrane-associated protein
VLYKLVDIFLHLDRHLAEFVQAHGSSTYGFLFLIIFMETGVVVTPFLPGDSLLFACGALATTGALRVSVLLPLLAAAAILGDNMNYWIGRSVGPRAFTQESRFFKREHLLRTQEFYVRHGGKTVFLARFVPIVRTFAPFRRRHRQHALPALPRVQRRGRLQLGRFVHAGRLCVRQHPRW